MMRKGRGREIQANERLWGWGLSQGESNECGWRCKWTDKLGQGLWGLDFGLYGRAMAATEGFKVDL